MRRPRARREIALERYTAKRTMADPITPKNITNPFMQSPSATNHFPAIKKTAPRSCLLSEPGCVHPPCVSRRGSRRWDKHRHMRRN